MHREKKCDVQVHINDAASIYVAYLYMMPLNVSNEVRIKMARLAYHHSLGSMAVSK